MADRTITVSLDFIANTSQAEASLRSLQTSLQNIGNMNNVANGGQISKEILKASEAANTLRISLQNAFNQKTGRLDLTKFSTSLKSAGYDADKLAKELSAIGPQGQKAFSDLTNSIIQSQTPLRATHTLANKLWDSLKRTIGWQFSSTAIHKFMGAIQSAYGYAQDLNQSLNNIRIVTGASTDEMAKFAEQANKAAKALSSTTTDYTDAALIYYQQGIRDEPEIAERTNTTIKLANVSRQSAEEVSSQMTAIWNNFDDGSHSLEYYADVITKLGATTAASSSEIAGGMEKFAAVAETVGLSYEYAASSLATIVATTRQSEDTVGTGLRTIFSRLEGLKLGDTLEDGTDLNKYSQALKTVGVNIKDASGGLKDMDTILDETAAKWDNLNQAQKVAFATTVGGVRQYTNLIALLDNWDMMEENIATARGSEGALQEQQDIYAESWEAAQKRVRAAAESLYSDLLDDKFFIGLTNGFGKVLEALDKFIDGIGGLKTVLPGLAILMNNIFGAKIQAGIANLSYTIAGMIPSVKRAREEADNAQRQAYIKAEAQMYSSGSQITQESQNVLNINKQILDLKNKLAFSDKELTENERQQIQFGIEILNNLKQQAQERGRAVDIARQQAQATINQASASGYSRKTQQIAGYDNSTDTWNQRVTVGQVKAARGNEAAQANIVNFNAISNAIAEYEALHGAIQQADISVKQFHNDYITATELSNSGNAIKEEFIQMTREIVNSELMLEELDQALGATFDPRTGQLIEQQTTSMEQLKNAIQDIDFGNLQNEVNGFLTELGEDEGKLDEFIQKLIQLRQQEDNRIHGAYNSHSNRRRGGMQQSRDQRVGSEWGINVRRAAGNNPNAQAEASQRAQAERHQIEEDLREQRRQERQNDRMERNVHGVGQTAAKPVETSSYEKFAAAVTQVGTATAQAQMAISTFSNALQTIQNPDATGLERLLSVLSAIGMGLPALVNSFSSFSTILQSVNKIQITTSTLTSLVTKKLVSQDIAQKLNLGTLLKLKFSKDGLNGVTLMETLGVQDNTLATEFNTIAKEANKIATLGLVAVIGLLAIGAVALTAHLIKVSDETYKAAQALEKSKKTAQSLTNVYNETKDAFEELKNSLTDYNDAVKGLEKLEEKSLEWKNAVADINSEVIDLLEKYPKLANYVDNINGVLTISKEGQQEVLKEQQQAMVKSNISRLQALKEVKQNENRVAIEQARDTINKETSRNISVNDFAKVVKSINESNGANLQNIENIDTVSGNTDLITALDNNKGTLNDLNKTLNTNNTNMEALDAQIVNEIESTSTLNTTILKWAGADSEEEDEDYIKAYEKEQRRVEQEVMRGIVPEQYQATDTGDNNGMWIKGFGNGGANDNFNFIADLYREYIDPNFRKVNITKNGEIEYSHTSADGTGLETSTMSMEQMWTQVRDAIIELENVTAEVDQIKQESFAKNNPQLDNLITAMADTGNINGKWMGVRTEGLDLLGNVLGQSDIDWSDTESAINKISQDLAALGVEVDPDLLAQYANQMHAINEAANDMGTAKITEASINVNDKYGDVLTAEQTFEQDPTAENAKNLNDARMAYLDATQALEDIIEEDIDNEIEALDLDTQAVKDMADYIKDNADSMKGVNKNIKDSQSAVKELAKEIVRADRAYESINDNMDDWQKVLKSSTKNAQDMARVTKQLRTTYSDLLDLDPTILSDGFLQSAENLDLLKKAANGSEEAYNQLMQNAQQDIEIGLHLDSNGEFQAKKAEVMSQLDEMRNLDPIEMEAQLNDEGFLNSLAAMVNAAGMSADQAAAYLETMGINAVITEAEPSTKPVTTTETFWVPARYSAGSAITTGGEEGQQGSFVPLQMDSPGRWQTRTSQSTVMTSPGGGALKIERATASGGGNIKYQNATHGGGSGGNKGKGGGGGGGGGGSKQSKDAPKADRGARYHAVTRRQSNVSRQQTENNRRKDRAFGKAQVELAREDLEIQKKKIELQEEYTKEISKNLKDDREEMKKQFEALQLPINFKFDEDGEIENYQEIIDALFEKEKALVEQYNSGGLDDEAFDEAKKKLDEAKESLGNYEETLELQKDELQTLEEYMEELADKALELTQIKFELNMSIIEDQLEWLDYSLSEIEDDAYSAAKAIALMGEQTSQYLKQGDTARAAILEILGRHGVNSIEELNGLSDSQIEALGFNKDEIDALKEYRSQLYESNQALLEMRRTITDKVLDTFNTFNEKVQESYDQFDKYNDILETYNNIVDLLGTKTDAATRRLVKNIRDTQLQNLRNQSVSAKEIYEGALANYNLAEKQYNDAVARYGANSIEAQQMEEIMKQAADARDEAYSSWLDAYQASLEKAREIYETEMEEIERDFERMVSGIYGTLGLFEAAYERAKELRENYVPEYEKIYELNKLNRDIQKEIDNSSSIKDRKALRQLQEEINRKQEAGVQLSKYEVEEMRKKFELEQARMRLEDARNNKSEVRLTRDGNGNWGYVYTAAEDEVADAEQKYEDALYNYQKLSDDYINDLDEKIKELTKNTQERLKEVAEALADGLITEDEAQVQREKILNDFYKQQDYLVSQFNISTNNLSNTIGLMYELYGREAELIDSFPETLFGEISEDGTIESWAETSKQGLLKYVDDIVKAYKTLQETNQKISDQNKLNLSDINTATQNITDKSTEAQKKVSDTVKEVSDSFTSTMQSLQDWDETYASIIKDAVDANKGFIDSLNQIIKQLAAISSYEMKDLYDQIDYMSAKVSRGEELTQADWDKLNEIKQRYADAYLKESAPFDTGGYTGEWGKEGKLAILHEKEYVLNADLTARFFDALKTFSLIDQFVNTENQMQQQKLQMQTLETLSHYIDQLADRMNTTTINPNDFSTSLLNSGNQQLEQNVHIEASFPNVTQSSEIEMAFDNLVNKASQYANRKNMSSMTFEDMYITKF